MSMDRAFIDLNRASTERMRHLAHRLSDAELQHPVGEHWTVAIVMAHLAFWDRRVMYVLDKTERDGKLVCKNCGNATEVSAAIGTCTGKSHILSFTQLCRSRSSKVM